MKVEGYWNLIGSYGSDWSQSKSSVSSQLENLGDEAKRDYIAISNELIKKLTKQDVYLGYFLLSDGFVGEDGWLDFRHSIIILGEQAFDEVSENPDRMIDHPSLLDFDEVSVFDLDCLDGFFEPSLIKADGIDYKVGSMESLLIKQKLPRLYERYGESAGE